MKTALILFCLAATVFAQKPAGSVPVACGRNDVDFKVKLNDPAVAVAQPAPGKALVYFIHDSGSTGLLMNPVMKMGVDGAWVGANHGDSWFSVTLDPGVHHLCATVQPSVLDHRAELVRFQAEAGKVYFYRTRLVMSNAEELLEFGPVDSDEGNYLAASFPVSVSQPKTHDGSRRAGSKGAR